LRIAQLRGLNSVEPVGVYVQQPLLFPPSQRLAVEFKYLLNVEEDLLDFKRGKMLGAALSGLRESRDLGLMGTIMPYLVASLIPTPSVKSGLQLSSCSL
jgi:hypothetical protein